MPRTGRTGTDIVDNLPPQIHRQGLAPVQSFHKPLVGRITRGKDGSFCYTRDGRSIHEGTGDVKAIDTVGAGDSLSAAFLYFLSAGCGEEEALRKASLLADYVVTRPGAIPEYDESIRKMLGIC